MFEFINVILQAVNQTAAQSLAQTTTDTIIGIMVALGIISTIALGWAVRLRNGLKNSNAEWAKKFVKALDDYVIPALEQGKVVADQTVKQETKIKQLAEVTFSALPDGGQSIKDKYEIKLVNLQKDIDSAVKGTVEYDNKLQEMYSLVAQIRKEIGLPPEPRTPIS